MLLLDICSGCWESTESGCLIGKGFQKRLMFELNPEALKEFPRRSRLGREQLMEGPDVIVSPVGSHIIKNKKNANQS